MTGPDAVLAVVVLVLLAIGLPVTFHVIESREDGARDARERADDAERALDDVEDVLDRFTGGQLDLVGQALADDVRSVLRRYWRGGPDETKEVEGS